MKSSIRVNEGAGNDERAQVRVTGAIPTYRTLSVSPGESLASLALRAYGSNTAETRERITQSNATLQGTVRYPV